MSIGIWSAGQAERMTAEQAKMIARREYVDAFEGSIGAGLALNGGSDFTETDWSIAYQALSDDHGPIDGCACELAGEMCDLNALRNYCQRNWDAARAHQTI